MKIESPFPFSLEQELSIRISADELWRQTWAKVPDLQSEKAFKEGFIIGCTMGFAAVKATSKIYRQREYYLHIVIALLIPAVAIAFLYK